MRRPSDGCGRGLGDGRGRGDDGCRPGDARWPRDPRRSRDACGPRGARGPLREFAQCVQGRRWAPVLALLTALISACTCEAPIADERGAAPPAGDAAAARQTTPTPSAATIAGAPTVEVPEDMSDETCLSSQVPPLRFERLDRAAARARIWPTPGPRAYLPPPPTRRQATAALIDALIRRCPAAPAELEVLAAAAGFTLEAWEVEGRRIVAALEEPEGRGGGGAYLFRVDVAAVAGPPVLLQAPHAMSDLDTGPLALDLLVDGDAWPRAVFVATLGRRYGIDGARGPADGPADPCHNDEHLLAVATAAALAAIDGLEVIQLHGFGEDEAAADPALAVIVSAGDRQPSPRSRTLRDGLGAATGARVALFPEDIDHLGALTNLQGAAVRRRGRGAQFLHLELSPELRRELRRSPEGRGRFAGALQGPEATRAAPPATPRGP